MRIKGVYGCRPAIQDRRFVCIEIGRDGESWTKGVDLDPALLAQLVGAIKRNIANYEARAQRVLGGGRDTQQHRRAHRSCDAALPCAREGEARGHEPGGQHQMSRGLGAAQKKVCEALAVHGRPMTAAHVARVTGIDPDNVRKILLARALRIQSSPVTYTLREVPIHRDACITHASCLDVMPTLAAVDHVIADRMTLIFSNRLLDALTEWLDVYADEHRPKTTETVTMYAEAHYVPFFRSASRFTTSNVEAYRRKRLGEVTRSTLRKELSGLRLFAEWWATHGGPRVEVASLPKHGMPGKRHRLARKPKATPYPQAPGP